MGETRELVGPRVDYFEEKSYTQDMRQQKKSRVMMMTGLGVFSVGLLLSIFGLSKTVENIDKIAISGEPEAILASAGVEEGSDISLPVSYFDQKADECVNLYDLGNNKELKSRQFEWSSCGYAYREIEQGLVEYELNEKYLPVATGAGKMMPDRGLTDLTRWFENVDGKSKAYTGTLKLTYEAGAEFSFESDEFYPLDEVDFSAGDSVNEKHNKLFTMNFVVPFTVTASGEENFEITADDDTFVFVGNRLVLDMGGIHEASTGKLSINEEGEVYASVDGEDLAYSGTTVTKDEGSIVRIFHADRDSKDSVFKVNFSKMNLNVVESKVAGTDGVQVAYDPNDLSYVAPLGETSVVKPDGTKGYAIMATILGVAIISCAMFAAIFAHALIKNRK